MEFAHIRSTCGPDLPRALHALRFDVQFGQGLPRKKSTVCRDPAVSDIVDEEKKEIDDDDFAMPEPIIVTQEYQRPKVKTTSKRGRPRGRPSKYESSMAIKVQASSL